MAHSGFHNWSLFLDRDGVINRRLPGAYVKDPKDFEFLPGAIEAIARLKTLFHPVVIVTNQQGIGKGLMTEADLESVHEKMLAELQKENASVDKIYHCPDLKDIGSTLRKPESGMALQAKQDFPSIDFEKSLIVGDSWSDMEFGLRLGMYCVFISNKSGEELELERRKIQVNATYPSLVAFTNDLLQTK